ncbi:hypothetical protein Tco_1348556 [Tanacetum coccineum]
MVNLTDMLSKFVTANTASTSGSGTLPGNTVTIQGPKAVNPDVEVTKDTMHPANNGSTEDVQPPIVQIQSRSQNPEPNVSPVDTPIPKASIPFPSRRNDERRKEKAVLSKVIRRCVHGNEALEILSACHNGPTEGHQSLTEKTQGRSGRVCSV